MITIKKNSKVLKFNSIDEMNEHYRKYGKFNYDTQPSESESSERATSSTEEGDNQTGGTDRRPNREAARV